MYADTSRPGALLKVDNTLMMLHKAHPHRRLCTNRNSGCQPALCATANLLLVGELAQPTLAAKGRPARQDPHTNGCKALQFIPGHCITGRSTSHPQKCCAVRQQPTLCCCKNRFSLSSDSSTFLQWLGQL